MSAATQKGRMLELTTPAGVDALLIQSFNGYEAISNLFAFQLTMFAEKRAVSGDALLGKSVTVAVNRPSGPPRFFNGIVSRFGLAGQNNDFIYYYADVVPQLWFLTRRTNCRIFQNLSVPDIVKKVLDGANIRNVVFALSRTYTTWDYCVQYHESDFNYISRLLEHEGIYYFFSHEKDKHTLVFADSPQSQLPVPGLPVARFEPVGGFGEREMTVNSWQEEQEIMPGKYTYRDHHFQLPDKTLEMQQASQIKVGGNDGLEIYDYPGNYAVPFDQPDKRTDKVEPEGRGLVKLHLEGYETAARIQRGASDCSAFSTGCRFELAEYPKKGVKSGPFVLTAIQHAMQQDSDVRSGGGPGGYSNSFSCIPHGVPFRPARVTGKPVIYGPQTAVVVGSKGEEIHVDKFGRVQVQFFWDREGKLDENSSCWVRVAQPIAGKRWGASFWPRVGQEVVVTFLEGNPDRPLIIGGVYNAGQMPPYIGDSPDSKHKHDPRVSGFKTNTTTGGTGYNELRFDDNKDKEQIFIHAQRNIDTRVGNESMESVAVNRHLTVGGEKDGKKQGDQREMVYQDKHLDVKRHQIEHIEGNMLLTVGGGDGDNGNQDIVIKKDKKELIKGDNHLHVAGARNEKVDGVQSLTVGGDQQEKVGKNHALEAGMAMHLKAGMTLVIEAGTELSLKVGGNFIDINPAGVFITGMMVMINSGGAAGSGAGAQPQAPQDAKEAQPTKPDAADNAKTGFKSAP